MDGWADGQTDKRTDGQTDRQSLIGHTMLEPNMRANVKMPRSERFHQRASCPVSLCLAVTRMIVLLSITPDWLTRFTSVSILLKTVSEIEELLPLLLLLFLPVGILTIPLCTIATRMADSC